MFKRFTLPAAALLALMAQPAVAAVFTFNKTIDASDILDFGTSPFFDPTGTVQLGTQRIQLAPTPLGEFAATLNQGDVIETNFTITNGALTLESLQSGSDEIIALTFASTTPFDVNAENPNLDPVVELTRTHELIVNAHTGTLNLISPYTDTVSLFGPSFANFYRGNITDSVVNLTSFTLRTTYDAINFVSPFDQQFSLPVDIQSGTFIVADQRVVPAPGALALLGFGLLGLTWRRRTA